MRRWDNPCAGISNKESDSAEEIKGRLQIELIIRLWSFLCMYRYHLWVHERQIVGLEALRAAGISSPPSYQRTRTQRDTMWSKEAFLAANITFCVRAACRDPWCFSGGDFSLFLSSLHLSVWWKSWQSHRQNATKPMKYEFMLWSGWKREASTDRRREILGLWLPVWAFFFFFFLPHGGNGGNELCSRYFLNSTWSEWHHAKIPKQVVSSVEGGGVRPSTCRLPHRGMKMRHASGHVCPEYQTAMNDECVCFYATGLFANSKIIIRRCLNEAPERRGTFTAVDAFISLV